MLAVQTVEGGRKDRKQYKGGGGAGDTGRGNDRSSEDLQRTTVRQGKHDGGAIGSGFWGAIERDREEGGGGGWYTARVERPSKTCVEGERCAR